LSATPECFRCGPARVAGRSHDNGPTLAALLQRVIHQAREQLHREILERKRRAMEELEHEQAGIELDKRRRRRVTKTAVGLSGHARQIGVSNAATDKGPDHVNGDFGVRLAGEARDRLAIERRPGFRDIESAIAGKTREHHLDKIKRGGLAPG